jgi:hypothetical protein
VTVRRFQELTGEKALHAETHLSFDETERRSRSHACAVERAKNQDEVNNNVE